MLYISGAPADIAIVGTHQSSSKGGALARASDRGMVGWRERLVLLLLSVLSGSLCLSTAWMSQEQQPLQHSRRKHVGIRGGGAAAAQGAETTAGLAGVGIGRSSSSLDNAYLGTRVAEGTAAARATAKDPSERVCVCV